MVVSDTRDSGDIGDNAFGSGDNSRLYPIHIHVFHIFLPS